MSRCFLDRRRECSWLFVYWNFWLNKAFSSALASRSRVTMFVPVPHVWTPSATSVSLSLIEPLLALRLKMRIRERDLSTKLSGNL